MYEYKELSLTEAVEAMRQGNKVIHIGYTDNEWSSLKMDVHKPLKIF